MARPMRRIASPRAFRAADSTSCMAMRFRTKPTWTAGTARTRIVRVTLEDFSPEAGTAVLAGDKPVGTMGSTAGCNGLALIRVDRAGDALASGMKLTSGGLAIRLTEPNDLLITPKQTVA